MNQDPVRIVSLLPSATELISVVLDESACQSDKSLLGTALETESDDHSTVKAILVGRMFPICTCPCI